MTTEQLPAAQTCIWRSASAIALMIDDECPPSNRRYKVLTSTFETLAVASPSPWQRRLSRALRSRRRATPEGGSHL
eukprot:1293367-Rhodomonas_salina.1